jgi:hypothetical protein
MIGFPRLHDFPASVLLGHQISFHKSPWSSIPTTTKSSAKSPVSSTNQRYQQPQPPRQFRNSNITHLTQPLRKAIMARILPASAHRSRNNTIPTRLPTTQVLTMLSSAGDLALQIKHFPDHSRLYLQERSLDREEPLFQRRRLWNGGLGCYMNCRTFSDAEDLRKVIRRHVWFSDHGYSDESEEEKRERQEGNARGWEAKGFRLVCEEFEFDVTGEEGKCVVRFEGRVRCGRS